MAFGDIWESLRFGEDCCAGPVPGAYRRPTQTSMYGKCCRYRKFEGYWRMQEYSVPPSWSIPWTGPTVKKRWKFWGTYSEECKPSSGFGMFQYCPPHDEECDKVSRYSTPSHQGAQGRICLTTVDSTEYDPNSQTCKCDKRTSITSNQYPYMEGETIQEACIALMDARGSLCKCPAP